MSLPPPSSSPPPPPMLVVYSPPICTPSWPHPSANNSPITVLSSPMWTPADHKDSPCFGIRLPRQCPYG
ncbi:hypothetical protein ACOSQ2_013553 [Xanthoceras sorbifolium]